MNEVIKSRWVITKGKWNNKKNKYDDISSIQLVKTIGMEIIVRDDKKILQFTDGPTGYERYYVDDLLRNNKTAQEELCICAGTINRWAECYVNWSDVLKFISKDIKCLKE